MDLESGRAELIEFVEIYQRQGIYFADGSPILKMESNRKEQERLFRGKDVPLIWSKVDLEGSKSSDSLRSSVLLLVSVLRGIFFMRSCSVVAPGTTLFL